MDAFATALGAQVVAVDAGRVTPGATLENWQLNAGVVAHGGHLSTLVDLACGLAVHSIPFPPDARHHTRRRPTGSCGSPRARPG
jgi:acyl-coenzyme A thioesterase PaaI-like protein